MNAIARLLVSGACVAATGMPLARAAAEGHFAKLPDGCEVWVLQDDATVQGWTGTCRDGKAEGRGVLTGTFVSKGQPHAWRFEGRIVAGRRTGFGHNAIEGVGVFDGQYRHGLPNGWGRSRLPNGATWEGQYRDGELNGIGTNVSTDGEHLTARWVKGEPTGVRRFVGPDTRWVVLDPAADGTARALSSRGGEYQAGQYRLVGDSFLREGTGMFFFKEANKVYVGHFEHNLPNGFGVFVAPDKKNPADAAAWPGNWNNGCNWRGNWYTNVIVDADDCRRR